MDDDFNPYEWHVGDPEDWADGIAGVPDIPYMGYLNNNQDDFKQGGNRPPRRPPSKSWDADETKARKITCKAWSLFKSGMYGSAMKEVDEAISIFRKKPKSYYRVHENGRYYSDALKVKAEICKSTGKCMMAIIHYDKSFRLRGLGSPLNGLQGIISKSGKNAVIRDIQGFKIDYSMDADEIADMTYGACKTIKDAGKSSDELTIGLEMAKMAGEFSPRDYQKGQFETLVENLERKVSQSSHYERTVKGLMGIGIFNLITIAGTRFYGLERSLKAGVKLKLIREPENVKDKDAIAVYLKDRKVGYVANSSTTNSDVSTKASDLRKVTDVGYAEYLINYDGRYHLAKLISKDDFEGKTSMPEAKEPETSKWDEYSRWKNKSFKLVLSGRYDKALEYLRKAFVHRPDDCQIQRHIEKIERLQAGAEGNESPMYATDLIKDMLPVLIDSDVDDNAVAFERWMLNKRIVSSDCITDGCIEVMMKYRLPLDLRGCERLFFSKGRLEEVKGALPSDGISVYEDLLCAILANRYIL